jgi:hypothetical protein
VDENWHKKYLGGEQWIVAQEKESKGVRIEIRVLINLKILNKEGKLRKNKVKTTTKNKNQCSANILDLFLWHKSNTDTYDWGFLKAPISSQGWYSRLCEEGCPSFQIA